MKKAKAVSINISSIRKVGYRQTYDLEIDDKNHNFVLANNIVTSNSHSLSYSMNAYVSMYLKVHYPKEYYTTLLNFSSNSDIAIFMKQAKSDGIKFDEFLYGKTSDMFEFDYDTNSMKFGLMKVKGIRNDDVVKINSSSNISDVYSLLQFVITNKISKKSIERLCRLNYFSNICANSKLLESLILALRNAKTSKSPLKSQFKQWLKENQNMQDWEESESFKFQKEYLDFYFIEHPFVGYYDIIKSNPAFAKQFMIPKLLDTQSRYKGVKVIGIVSEIFMKKAKKTGREYFKIVLEDDEKQINIMVWDSASLANITKGNFIIVPVSNNDYGFVKERGGKIEKLI
jgi:DNA polymerase III subunit alpha